MENKTKKCPKCQTDIPEKAKKCPNCQSDLRNWFRRHPVLAALGVFIIFIIAISAIGGGSKKVGETPGQITQEKTTEYKIGDQVKIGSAIITVNNVEFSQGGAFTKPTEGNKWLNLNVTIENTGSSNQYVTTLGQMFIRDDEGNSYQVAVTDKTLEGAGTFGLDGNIIAKSKRTGWVGFEVRNEAKGLKFQYNASMFGGKTVTIDLGL
ncbi:MAG: hypothetical protein DDT40_01585 [candidate division WS2 bacterium]|nr:hypothetical protein [Candidatus Psychracetigena formicireducens]